MFLSYDLLSLHMNKQVELLLTVMFHLYAKDHITDLLSYRWNVLERGTREELALGLFVTRSRIGGLDKMSPYWQVGFYLLVLGADNS